MEYSAMMMNVPSTEPRDLFDFSWDSSADYGHWAEPYLEFSAFPGDICEDATDDFCTGILPLGYEPAVSALGVSHRLLLCGNRRLCGNESPLRQQQARQTDKQVRELLARFVENLADWSLADQVLLYDIAPDVESRQRAYTRQVAEQLGGVLRWSSQAVLLNFEAARKPTAAVSSCLVETVLQTFEGKVENVEGRMATLSLRDCEGRESFAEFSVDALAAQGISYGMRFTCSIRQHSNGESVLAFQVIPERRLTDEEWASIQSENSAICDGYDASDDY